MDIYVRKETIYTETLLGVSTSYVVRFGKDLFYHMYASKSYAIKVARNLAEKYNVKFIGYVGEIEIDKREKEEDYDN